MKSRQLTLSTWIWKIAQNKFGLFVFESKKQQELRVTRVCLWLFVNQTNRPPWDNTTAVKCCRSLFEIACIDSKALRFEVLLCYFQYFMDLISSCGLQWTQDNPFGNEALNAKLCLVNKSVGILFFCRLGLLNFNTSKEQESLPGKSRRRMPGCVCAGVKNLHEIKLTKDVFFTLSDLVSCPFHFYIWARF